MNTCKTASLCGINYELGSIHGIDATLFTIDPEESLKLFIEKGVGSYSKFDGPITEVIQRSVLRSLSDAMVPPEEVDCVLIISESFSGIHDSGAPSSDFRDVRNLLFDILADVGIANAAIFCTAFGGSSNFLQAIFMVKPLIEAGIRRNVLFVCVDRLTAGQTRVMDVAVAVTGDGVATCVVTQEPKSTAPIFSIEYAGISPYRTSKHKKDWNHLILEMYRATKNAAADCYEAMGLQPGDFSWLILSNYNELTTRVFSRLLGIGIERTFLNNTSRTGHIPSCDSLINLKDLADSTNLHHGLRLLLYLNGPISCGTIALTTQSVST